LVSAHLGEQHVALKWPNDVLVTADDGRWAKLSGILLEREGNAVVIGVGVNLANHPPGLDRATTSIAAITGAAPDAASFLQDLAESFAYWLTRWRGEGLSAIRGRWLARAHPVGTPLTAATADGRVETGLFDGLDADGALRLRLADGSARVIHAADVFLV